MIELGKVKGLSSELSHRLYIYNETEKAGTKEAFNRR